MEKRVSKKTRLFFAGALVFAAGALFVLFGGVGRTRVYADEILYSGTDGDLDWSITESGVLTIEGTGDYGSGNPDWVAYSNYFTSAVVNVTGITRTAGMFYFCDLMESVDLTSLDTSKVTDMSAMFYYCSALTDIDLSSFDTSKVTNMRQMFYFCKVLTDVNASSFDTSKVTDMSQMFYNCKYLTSLDLSNFDTSNVTNMTYMFFQCTGLTSLDVSGFDTSKVTMMYGMFEYCNKLTTLDVTNFDTSSVTRMGGMFYQCSKMKTLDVSGFDTSKVTDFALMFYGCTATELDVSNFDTSAATDMEGMFNGCTGVSSLDVSGFDTSSVTTITKMFYNCSALTELNLGSFDMSSVTSYSNFLASCSSLTKVVMPANALEVDLPTVSGYFWADEKTVTCTAVTAGLSSSMTYYRYADGEEATTAGSVTTTTQSQTTAASQTTTVSQTTTTTSGTTTTVSGTTTQAGTSVTETNAGTSQNSQTEEVTGSIAQQTTAGTTGTGNSATLTTEEPTVVVADDDIDLTQSVADDTQVDVNLATPVLTCAVNESEGVLVNWEPVDGATSYRVYRQTGSDGWEAVADTADVSYTDTAAESGSVCAYTVCAILTNGDSEQRSESASGKSTVRLETPKVSGVTRDGQDAAKITVRWQGAGTVTAYQLQYSTDASFEEGTITLTIESPSATSAEILTAAEGDIYVRVRSYTLTTSGAKYFSDWSEAQG